MDCLPDKRGGGAARALSQFEVCPPATSWLVVLALASILPDSCPSLRTLGPEPEPLCREHEAQGPRGREGSYRSNSKHSGRGSEACLCVAPATC
ncbi:hypothetical protein BV20DRAFT_455176 [Pilatotrama ljubarskyi]|nr:hypothetical protein BV20DRAFT_455176 [Pilatotrama ljubarskyi]